LLISTVLEKRKLQGFEPRTVRPVASRYADRAVAASSYLVQIQQNFSTCSTKWCRRVKPRLRVSVSRIESILCVSPISHPLPNCLLQLSVNLDNITRILTVLESCSSCSSAALDALKVFCYRAKVE